MTYLPSVIQLSINLPIYLFISHECGKKDKKRLQIAVIFICHMLPAVTTVNVPDQVRQSVQEAYCGHYGESPRSSAVAGDFIIDYSLFCWFVKQVMVLLRGSVEKKDWGQVNRVYEEKIYGCTWKQRTGTKCNGHRCWWPGINLRE